MIHWTVVVAWPAGYLIGRYIVGPAIVRALDWWEFRKYRR